MEYVKDYKKEYKDLYVPKTVPVIVDIPEMMFVAVEGRGNPNDQSGAYQKAVELLYNIQYTIKMSKKGNYIPDGYFDYVVPPLESFWWLGNSGDWSSKSEYNWLAAIRLPEFITDEVFEWARSEASKKKKIDVENAQYLIIKEGLCVQCMHAGSYDDEPKTLKLMDDFIAANRLEKDINETRRHHEIYLSNPNKTEISKLKTVLRIPVKNI